MFLPTLLGSEYEVNEPHPLLPCFSGGGGGGAWAVSLVPRRSLVPLAGERLVAWCNFLVTNTFPIWNLKRRMKSQKTQLKFKRRWRHGIAGCYSRPFLLRSLRLAFSRSGWCCWCLPLPRPSRQLNHGRSKWMSDTLYSNLAAWLSHCPLAWHRIAPCILRFVYWKGLALEGLKCAFVRIVHSCLGHSESYNTYSLRAVECNLKWIPWHQATRRLFYPGRENVVWVRD